MRDISESLQDSYLEIRETLNLEKHVVELILFEMLDNNDSRRIWGW